jgi:hypothetical protein
MKRNAALSPCWTMETASPSSQSVYRTAGLMAVADPVNESTVRAIWT